MQAQATVSAARLAQKVGRTMDVIVDAVEGAKAIARSAADAPEIDGIVRVSGSRDARPGDIIRVKITAASEHDLEGKMAA